MEQAAGTWFANRDGVARVRAAARIRDRIAQAPAKLGVHAADVGITAVVIAAVELNVAVGSGPEPHPSTPLRTSWARSCHCHPCCADDGRSRC